MPTKPSIRPGPRPIYKPNQVPRDTAASGNTLRDTTNRNPVFRLPERFFGNGPPQWTDRKKRRPPQTPEEAATEQQKLVKYLRAAGDAQTNTPLLVPHKGGTGDHHHGLADIIEGCRTGNQCKSDACPNCRRALQRAIVGAFGTVQMGERFRQETGEGRSSEGRSSEWARLSIISNIRIRGGDDLVHMGRQLRKVTQEFHGAFDQVGLSWAFGGIDVSLNIYKGHPRAIQQNGSFRPFFQFHLYAFAPFAAAHHAKPRLKQLFPATKVTKVPVQVSPQPYDGHPAGLAYAMKPQFTRRFTVPAHEGENGEKVRQDTRDKPLTIEEKVQLATMLHLLGPWGRLFLHGVEVVNDGNGELVLKRYSGQTP